MEQPREQEWRNAPTLSAEYSKTKDLFNKDRSRAVWNLGKRELASTSLYPSLALSFQLGVDRRTIYGWMSGKHKPNPLSLAQIGATFSRLLGEDWQEQVDRLCTT